MTGRSRNGQFVWRELMSADVDASVRFYTEAFGWNVEPMKMPDGVDYRVMKVGELGVGGIMKHLVPGAPAFWSGVVAVDDADAAASRAAAAEALEFYGKVFGWTNKPFSAGGDMKVLEAGAAQVASVMASPPGVPAHWLSYVVVDKLTSAYDRVRQQGGKVMVERIDVPTVGAIGVIQDNVGAMLGVFEAPAG